MRRRAREWREICAVRPTRCATILVYGSVRDWTRFLRHRIRKYPDSPFHTLSDSLQIYFFPLRRTDLFFFSGFAVEFAGCVWTVVVSGKKKLRIRKYPDTCGRGLNCKISLRRDIKNSEIYHAIAPDLTFHYFGPQQTCSGTRIWKFNNTLLNDMQYASTVRDTYAHACSYYSNVTDKRLIREFMKMESRSATIAFPEVKENVSATENRN